eukprot:gene23422-28420_t
MGIRGLWTKVLKDTENNKKDFVENVPRGSTIHVDAMGFIFHACETSIVTRSKQTRPPQIERQFGGSYGEFKRLLDSEISRLTIDFGFQLIFYFDGAAPPCCSILGITSNCENDYSTAQSGCGPASYFKGHTTIERQCQFEEKRANMFEMCLGDRKIAQKDLPLPPLSQQALICLIGEYNIQVVNCLYEADQELALGCVRGNKEGNCEHFCYSSDSDMLLMKECSVIKFGAFNDNQYETVTNKGNDTLDIVVPVYSLEKLAKYYQLTTNQFVTMCILRGNDFTTNLPGFEASRSFESVFREVKLGHPDRQLSCADPFADAAVRYSYAFYGLEDLTSFYKDEYKTMSQLDELGVLQSETYDGLYAWLEENNELNNISHSLTETSKQSSRHDKLSYSKMVLDLVLCLIEERCISNSPDDVEDGITNIIFEHHVSAIREMSDNLIALRLKPPDWQKVNVEWENVKAGEFYQLLVREPMLVYDGHWFHKLASDKKREAPKKKAPEPVESASISPLPAPSAPVSKSALLKGLLAGGVTGCVQEKAEEGISAPNGDNSSSLDKLRTPSQVCTRQNSKPRTTLATSQDALVSKQSQQRQRKETEVSAQGKPLPVDAFKETILSKIQRDRVTIIHGETGCGKSSRIPYFIYEDSVANNRACKIMISQPRRLAVVNLKNRLQEQLGSKVGMRMGHGVREESGDTQLYFVTSGYLVQLLAHTKHACNKLTHIIIDEVHERSVDSDLLCFLVRKLLLEYPHLRVVLMSATLHTQLYKDYFGFEDQRFGDLNCISVGARRFPVDIFYPEDLEKAGKGPIKHVGDKGNILAERIASTTKVTKPVSPNPEVSYLPNITNQLMKDQYELCVVLVRTQAELGTAVLIFVAGLDDIIEVQAKFDGLTKYKVIPIHSQIPFEEQEQALVPAEPTEIKVIVATNAAESSITLPDCDMVICLGMHKEVNFLPTNMLRSVLKRDFISKSSATQRAGRTGRVRPGKCFRLYSKQAFEQMHDFPTSEMHRMPLHEVILNLQATFESSSEFKGVSNILLSLLEPPSVESIKSSQKFLFSEHMITAPNDKGLLTSVGSFAGRMPVDLLSSKLIIYGICLGIGVEAIVIASAIAQPKTLFRIMHPLIHSDPDEYNKIVRQTFFGTLHFDQFTYSDVISMLNIFITWHGLKEHTDRFMLCTKYGLVMARIKHFYSSATHILSRVKSISTVTCDMSFDYLPVKLSKLQVNRIRLIMCWVYHTNLMTANEGGEQSSQKKKGKKSMLNLWIEENNDKIEIRNLDKNAVVLSTDCLDAMFPKNKHVKYTSAILGKRTYFYRCSNKQSVIYSNYRDMETCFYRSFCCGLDGRGILLMSLVLQMTQTVSLPSDKKSRNRPVKQTVDMSVDCILGFSIDNREDPKKDKYLGYVYAVVSQFVNVDVLELNTDESGTTKPCMLCVVKVFNGTQDVVGRLRLVVEGLGSTQLPYVIAQVCMSHQPNPHEYAPSPLYSPTPPPVASLAQSGLFVDAEVRVIIDHFDPPSSLFAALNATTNTLQLSNTHALRQEVLLFDSDDVSDEEEESKEGKEEKSDGEDKKTKAKAKRLDSLGSVKKEDRLFEDLCVGKRLFNAYCSRYKDRKMKLRDSCFTPVDGKKADKKDAAPVIGSKEYAERKQKAADGEEGNAVVASGGDAYKVVSLDCKPKTMGWTVLNLDDDANDTVDAEGAVNDGDDTDDGPWKSSGENREDGALVCLGKLPWVRGFITSRSIVSTAYYSSIGVGDAGRLMGVAYNTLMLSAVGRHQLNIACEGITLFPPGSLWISRALCCIGKSLGEAEELVRWVKGDAAGRMVANGEDPLDLCEAVRVLLGTLKERFICPNSLLMDKVNALFAEFED